MKTSYAATIALALATLSSGYAVAAGGGRGPDYPAASTAAPSTLSRADVRAELAEAQRTGDIQVGDQGKKLNELYPSRYPAKVEAPGKTRAEVRDEVVKARLNGELVASYGNGGGNAH